MMKRNVMEMIKEENCYEDPSHKINSHLLYMLYNHCCLLCCTSFLDNLMGHHHYWSSFCRQGKLYNCLTLQCCNALQHRGYRLLC